NAVLESVSGADQLINRWLVSEKGFQARRLFRQIIENSEKALSTVHDAIYFPSQVFRVRFGIDAELQQLDDALHDRAGDREALLAAARACLLLTEFRRCDAYADAALALDEEDALAIACKGLASGMRGDLDRALEHAATLERLDSRHPMAMEARLLALLMQAAKVGGMSDVSELLRDAQQLFLEPVEVDSGDAMDTVEAHMLEARANTLFPDAINRREAAIDALRSVLAQLEQGGFELHGLALEGLRMAQLIYAHFYLGQLLQAQGDTGGAQLHYEKVIQIDPSSNFGEAAYLSLGDTRQD
ncbi:MAG: hypothetical protein R3228_16395, partial [Halioglobus sp.]|nr:hypothetical protein [Halioglobus sp.]